MDTEQHMSLIFQFTDHTGSKQHTRCQTGKRRLQRTREHHHERRRQRIAEYRVALEHREQTRARTLDAIVAKRFGQLRHKRRHLTLEEVDRLREQTLAVRDHLLDRLVGRLAIRRRLLEQVALEENEEVDRCGTLEVDDALEGRLRRTAEHSTSDVTCTRTNHPWENSNILGVCNAIHTKKMFLKKHIILTR